MTFAAIAILVLAALGLVLADGFAARREPGFLRGLALLAIALAVLVTGAQIGAPELDLGGFRFADTLLADQLTAACDLLVLVALAGVVALAPERKSGLVAREPLLLLVGAAASVCIHAGDLLVVWLALELFAMTALLVQVVELDRAAIVSPSQRASILIQLVPGAVVSCLTLLGIALIYAAIGTTELDGFGRAATGVFTQWGGVQRWIPLVTEYADRVAAQDPHALEQARAEIVRGVAPAALLLPGILLLLFGLLAKLGLLPFARRRELVERAPIHVTALWSTIAVVALVSVLLRVFVGAMHSPRLVNEPYGWTGALPTVALLTGGWASIAATRQRRLPRMITLLALVQLSLLLLGVVAAANFHGHIGAGARSIAPEYEILWARLAGDEAYAAVLIQLVAHVLAMLGCFAAIAAGAGTREGSDGQRLRDWVGMASRRPGLALAFAICLLSLIGLPPLAGFVGKLGLLRAIVEHSAMRWMLIAVVFELAIGAWVVVRLITAMLSPITTNADIELGPAHNPWPTRTAYGMAALSLALGLGGHHLIVFARLPAAGGSFEPGDPNRLEWLEQRRANWAIEDDRATSEPEPEPAPESKPEPEEPGQSIVSPE